MKNIYDVRCAYQHKKEVERTVESVLMFLFSAGFVALFTCLIAIQK